MKFLLTILFAITLLSGCSSADAEFSRMSGQEAYELFQSNPDVFLIDVRSAGEFAQGHIPGSITLPANEVEARITDITKNQEAIILVICQSGNRSQTASQLLADLGYTNVYDIGGIISWPGEVVD
ncbi:MAG: rhodanese-like domain-containing protein [Turicibacter sp.]|nr:rhodanese-like domain-containing protein [Turicibacter sp.]